MNQVKIGLIAAVVVLLLFQVIDRMNEPARMEAVKESLDAQAQAFHKLSASLERLAEAPPPTVEADPEATAALRELVAEVQGLRAEVRALELKAVTVAVDGGGDPVGQAETDPDEIPEQQPEGATEPVRDGLVREGANFLLPPDHSHFQPDRVGGTLRTFNTSPAGLNPILENAATVTDIHNQTNDSLCTRDGVDPARWRSVLATSLVISEDYTVYTFEIRPGVMWQVPRIVTREPEQYAWLAEPRELTAEDFVFMVEMAKHPDVQAPAAQAYFEDLEKAEALDRYTLRLTWSRKIYTSLATSMGLSPLPRHIYAFDRNGTALAPEKVPLAFNDHWFDEAKQVVGVGPWKLVEYQADDVIRFRRNRDYWGPGDHFDEIEQNCAIREDDPQLTAFKNGQVHAHGLSPTQYKTNILDGGEGRFDRENPREGELAWERTKSLVYYYIGWNMRRPKFADKRVRQAMSHAFPKHRIIDEVFFGLGQPQVGNVHPDSDYYNDELRAIDYDYNLDRAQELLYEAGWEDSDGDGLLDKLIDGERVPFSFEVKYYANSPEWDRTLAIYQSELRNLGINMKPLPLEWKLLLRVYEDRDFDAVGGGWRMGYEVDFEQLWHSKYADEPRSSNHCGFADERADVLAEELRRTFDFAERQRIAREFQAIIHEEQPYTFFRSGEGIFIWQNSGEQALGGVTDALDKLHPFYNRDSSYWYLRE